MELNTRLTAVLLDEMHAIDKEAVEWCLERIREAGRKILKRSSGEPIDAQSLLAEIEKSDLLSQEARDRRITAHCTHLHDQVHDAVNASRPKSKKQKN